MAKEVSSWSRDPSSKIGATVVSPKNIILATGWNGFPRNIKDTDERLNNREIKYKYTVHAEMNCIYNACYTGNSLDNSSLYVYGLPTCSKCCLGVVQSGINKVYMMYKKNIAEKWQEEFKFTESVFNEANVEYNIFYCEETN